MNKPQIGSRDIIRNQITVTQRPAVRNCQIGEEFRSRYSSPLNEISIGHELGEKAESLIAKSKSDLGKEKDMAVIVNFC